MQKKAIIIGAGPAGLTAAYELLARTDIIPIILEKSGDIGGISKTINYKGNRMDIGGHRFFSKSDRVMQWWLKILPLLPEEEKGITISYRGNSTIVRSIRPSPAHERGEIPDKVMLVRDRLSRIYFLRKFFAYPVQLTWDTLSKLGLLRTMSILLSYLAARLLPRKPEKSLEDFMINRFGVRLYCLFFRDYTEKVWGVPCEHIPAEWGAQRIKGISIGKALLHAARSLKPSKKDTGIAQKDTETSLIERFLYPKYGPGQLWEEVARQIEAKGGIILKHYVVRNIRVRGDRIEGVFVVDTRTSVASFLQGDYFFSTMPVRELVAGMGDAVPKNVREVAAGLQYRDFITVGILLNKMTATDRYNKILPDTWIYIQEKDVKVGRLQIFNNWSPYMVKDPDTVWIGMEYFCNQTDAFWQLSDEDITELAIAELEKIGLADWRDVLDSTVQRMEKTYPAYFGTYDRFDEIRQFTDRFENLFLVGRNGMHKYNNSDHSMLTAMVAVDNIIRGVKDKVNIWAINTEQEYHEEKAAHSTGSAVKSPEATIKSPGPEGAAAPVLPPAEGSFNHFLFGNRRNRAALWFAGLALVLQFIIFKFFYPQAGFISGDSYVYLETARFNWSINTYPIGYSSFLRLFSVFTNSDTVLVAFQYLFMQVAALGLIFTLFFFYRPGKLVRGILFAFIVFNPVFLYLANYVSSDALFLALSLLWFTSLLWIIQRPTLRVILFQVLVLFLAFIVRYNALYYPVITTIALLLSGRKTGIAMKLTGIAASFLVIAAFMGYTAGKYKQLSGIRQFSPFSGWQLANNAMYAYRFVDSVEVHPAPARFGELDHVVRHYFDTSRNLQTHPMEALIANTYYMWDPRSPLQVYMNKQARKQDSAQSLKKWATVGPLYADYGSWLIRQYPAVFARYYLWPNARKYYAPPVEFLGDYNMGRDTIAPIARQWFGYRSSKAKTAFKDLKVTVLDFYPVLTGSFNALFLIGLLSFLTIKGSKQNRLSPALILAGIFWLANFGFSVFASPIALRFQLFPSFVFTFFTLLSVEYVCKVAFTPPDKLKELYAPRNLSHPVGNTKLA